MEIGAIIAHVLLFIVFYFEVFLLVSFIERQRSGTRDENATASYSPSVCLIVPCFNEERTLAATLDSLLALAYPKEKLEIVIVNDGSTDTTQTIAKRYTRHPHIRIFKKANGGKHTALNLALKNTEAELIGCLDADSVVKKDALARLVHAFQNPRVAAITPGIHVHTPHSFIQHLQNVEYRLAIFNRYAFAGLGSIFITPGPFSIFRAETVRKVGGWRHGHSTEDMELGLRLQEHGWLILNEPRAEVYTSAPRSLAALIRQRIRWNYGFFKNALDYRHLFGNPRFGNLGLIVLPAALLSMFAAFFFIGRVLWYGAQELAEAWIRFNAVGITTPSVDPFFINTSTLILTVYILIALTVVLIALGTRLSTVRGFPPLATPAFLVLYGFMVPLWLSASLVKAVLNTGVSWR
ncbi:hypothetical protein A2673_03530 [Candidatus Kaiserbacteria bacterium RIFCSPHIGHO2_01_FULL_50_13]|uniref:Beta-monoglucosyldiacylglycerol synthase n=1 Tax=Candidatus Kaiserbacteria bacterium RIFCSPLOWO2_01_FULL_50_24 TaxID=1798507 RepID=A0A1F6EMN2_9BACT|nr:MAG: hypothetical protein A2673_03530 [Candidatus Kaiserbacteria bacterium RIFCSPHIGHO2_01_FULL_50_13]OGG74898.1 MAG: hypothetical protein A3A34_03710 [Candidatus Kaiserbacteria bacterium RIFCSPLOWO2_01_FULL_50_24]